MKIVSRTLFRFEDKPGWMSRAAALRVHGQTPTSNPRLAARSRSSRITTKALLASSNDGHPLWATESNVG